jgi:hypothetical protein
MMYAIRTSSCPLLDRPDHPVHAEPLHAGHDGQWRLLVQAARARRASFDAGSTVALLVREEVYVSEKRRG